MLPKRKNPEELEWQKEPPEESGVYDYKGTLHGLRSGSVIDCSESCRVNLRTGDGLRMLLYGEDGQEYDITRTGSGYWRGPIGPVHIPVEDARRTES